MKASLLPLSSSCRNGSSPSPQVKNPAHGKLGSKRQRSSFSSAAGAGAGAVVAGVPVAPPGVPRSVAAMPPPAFTTKASVGTVKWKFDIKSQVARNGGLTRGQRLALSHRHYDVRAAVEVLRRSPLPESAVWRKMRQIVAARFVAVSVSRCCCSQSVMFLHADGLIAPSAIACHVCRGFVKSSHLCTKVHTDRMGTTLAFSSLWSSSYSVNYYFPLFPVDKHTR